MISEKIFSERVRQLRSNANLSQQQLGEIIGLSKQAINDIERERRSTALNKAIALADYFGVSLDYLVGRSDDPERH